MLRFLLLSLCAAVCVSPLVLIGCDDDESGSSSFDVGPDGEYPIPGLGLNNAVSISVRHVGFEPRISDDDPSIGNVRVLDKDSTLAEDMLMFQGETLRFNYDDNTYELTVEDFYLPSTTPGDPGVRATLTVERL